MNLEEVAKRAGLTQIREQRKALAGSETIIAAGNKREAEHGDAGTPEQVRPAQAGSEL
jgi:hypothetical protein